MKSTKNKRNTLDRILIVDDNPEIHSDIKKILNEGSPDKELERLFAELMDQQISLHTAAQFEIDSALSGEEAVALVREAKQNKKPYALAYVDMRMPPGLDGLRTIRHLQQEDNNLQYVIVTAYADYSWQDINTALLAADNLIILKKPFESIEIRQSASALIEKWHVAEEHRQAMSALVVQRNMLEEHVLERTAELRHTNEQLEKEIRERKRAEEKLRLHRDSLEKQVAHRSTEIVQQNRFLNTVIDSLPHPFAVIDIATGRVMAANWAVVHPAADHSHLKSCCQYSHGLEHPCSHYGLFCPLESVREHGQAMTVEHSYTDRLGHERTVEIHACPIIDGQGKITRAIEYCIDITSRKKMEEELIKGRKMKTASIMAGGIAHDFNNLLMAIMGNIELALMYLHQDHRSYTFLQSAAEVSVDAKNLVHKFLLFSNFDPPSRKALALRELISTSCQGVLSGTKVAAEVGLPDSLWPVYADPGQLDQALREIFRNAAEASPAGATIWVSGENHPMSENGRKQGAYVRITIKDEGSGITQEDLPNIFDPYFSRKTRGIVKGMGLGLTIAAAIIQQHGGYIAVDSRPDQGTSVHIDLPAAIEEHKASAFLI